MDGSKGRHLLANHNGLTSHIEFKLWKRIYDWITYHRNNTECGLNHGRSWESLDTMIPLFERHNTEEITNLKNVLYNFT